MRRILLPVCVLLFGCASAPSSDVLVTPQAGNDSPSVTLSAGKNAFTLCRDGEPESWFRGKYRTHPRTVAHEKRHREQLRSDPRGCEVRLADFMMRYGDEVDAFCAGIEAGIEAGLWTYRVGVAWSAMALDTYGFPFKYTDILLDLDRECQK